MFDPVSLGVMAGGSILSSVLGSSAARDASRAQERAAQMQYLNAQHDLAFRKGVYNEQKQKFSDIYDDTRAVYNDQRSLLDQTSAGLAPYQAAGAGAMGLISDLYGLGGGAAFGEGSLARFRTSPDYAFAFDEGRRALENSAAARGGLLSGNFARGITQFGQNHATGFLDNYTKRLLGIADMGRSSVISQGQLGIPVGQLGLGMGQLGVGMGGVLSSLTGQVGNAYGNIGSAYGNIGSAQASGIVGGANAMTGGINSGVNNYLLYNALGNRGSYSPNVGLSSSINPGVAGGGYLGSGGEVFAGPGYYQ